MSAPSKIAAIRHAVSALHGAADDGADTRRYAAALQEAGAALDDLIAAGSRVTAAFRALGVDSSPVNRSRLVGECEESLVAFDSALARVQAGAA
ncbi:hypothetical protein JY409_04540 [Stenotrophomonas maltophilia]|nr:hypothetical protein [Stenotrophomonas maltophilia]